MVMRYAFFADEGNDRCFELWWLLKAHCKFLMENEEDEKVIGILFCWMPWCLG